MKPETLPIMTYTQACYTYRCGSADLTLEENVRWQLGDFFSNSTGSGIIKVLKAATQELQDIAVSGKK